MTETAGITTVMRSRIAPEMRVSGRTLTPDACHLKPRYGGGAGT